MSEKYHKDFGSFYLFYLSQHMRTGTRAVHYFGTWTILIGTALAFAGPSLATSGFLTTNARWFLIPGTMAYMYLTAFISHWTIEKNQPATFVYPWYSVFGDLYMFWRMTTRQIVGDVRTVRERLASGWAVDKRGFYPPEYARANHIQTDRKMVSVAA